MACTVLNPPRVFCDGPLTPTTYAYMVDVQLATCGNLTAQRAIRTAAHMVAYRAACTETADAVVAMAEEATREVRDTLIRKNRAYGNSAGDPIRVFSSASTREQFLVRMDDKLSRLIRGVDTHLVQEDTYLDLIGYLVLYYITQAGSAASEIGPVKSAPTAGADLTVDNGELSDPGRDFVDTDPNAKYICEVWSYAGQRWTATTGGLTTYEKYRDTTDNAVRLLDAATKTTRALTTGNNKWQITPDLDRGCWRNATPFVGGISAVTKRALQT